MVRLRHSRIGVNFLDICVRGGLYRTLTLPGTPGTPGVEFDLRRWPCAPSIGGKA